MDILSSILEIIIISILVPIAFVLYAISSLPMIRGWVE